MASAHEFLLLGDHGAAKRLVEAALVSEGFVLTPTPNGGLLAKRGSMPLTLLIGALAGKKNFHVTFIVEYLVSADGQLVVRLNRNMGSGAIKGGALGAVRVDNAFRDTVNAIHAAMPAGVLAGTAAR
ncbi:hypothetical protein [Leifsonia sp. C5G2]|uniref:hypothetical protein n=1 Tax=Leifsonia sp. C5G2 TaxID=2735269 RepID=UPI001585B5EB|nr:hypothetical protein [Leifsonia sp. C5G2]NUU04828.1 hypothetical protein [Leifsonia sp. C5G2]